MFPGEGPTGHCQSFSFALNQIAEKDGHADVATMICVELLPPTPSSVRVSRRLLLRYSCRARLAVTSPRIFAQFGIDNLRKAAQLVADHLKGLCRIAVPQADNVARLGQAHTRIFRRARLNYIASYPKRGPWIKIKCNAGRDQWRYFCVWSALEESACRPKRSQSPRPKPAQPNPSASRLSINMAIPGKGSLRRWAPVIQTSSPRVKLGSPSRETAPKSTSSQRWLLLLVLLAELAGH